MLIVTQVRVFLSDWHNSPLGQRLLAMGTHLFRDIDFGVRTCAAEQLSMRSLAAGQTIAHCEPIDPYQRDTVYGSLDAIPLLTHCAAGFSIFAA